MTMGFAYLERRRRFPDVERTSSVFQVFVPAFDPVVDESPSNGDVAMTRNWTHAGPFAMPLSEESEAVENYDERCAHIRGDCHPERRMAACGHREK